VTGVSPATPVLRNVRVRSIAAAMLAVLAVAVAFDLSRLSPLQGAWFDTCERLVPRPVATTPVTIVAIDDRSLAAIGR